MTMARLSQETIWEMMRERGRAVKVACSRISGTNEIRLAVVSGNCASWHHLRVWYDAKKCFSGPFRPEKLEILGDWEGPLPPNLPLDPDVIGQQLGFPWDWMRWGEPSILRLIEETATGKDFDMTMTEAPAAPAEVKHRPGRKTNVERAISAAELAVRTAMAAGVDDQGLTVAASVAFHNTAPKVELPAPEQLAEIVARVRNQVAQATQQALAVPEEARVPTPATVAKPASPMAVPPPHMATPSAPTTDTMTAYVVYQIIGDTPRHMPVLFVTNIPRNVGADNREIYERVKRTLEAHFDFSHMGIPWANHEVYVGLRNAPAEVQRAWRTESVQRVDWRDLMDDELPE